MHVTWAPHMALTTNNFDHRTFLRAVVAWLLAVIYSVKNNHFWICGACEHTPTKLSQPYPYSESHVSSPHKTFCARVSGIALHSRKTCMSRTMIRMEWSRLGLLDWMSHNKHQNEDCIAFFSSSPYPGLLRSTLAARLLTLALAGNIIMSAACRSQCCASLCVRFGSLYNQVTSLCTCEYGSYNQNVLAVSPFRN